MVDSVAIGKKLTLEDVLRVAEEETPVSLPKHAEEAMGKSREVVTSLIEQGAVVYGVNTGVGQLATERIEPEDIARLQVNIIRSHSAGVGEPFSIPVTRAIMLLRAHTLAKGYSGVRPAVPKLLVELLNRKIHPILPSQGSVGASGDLAPLAHLALSLLGEGEVRHREEAKPALQAMEEEGLTPLQLEAKEGLSLINGTQVMSAIGLLTLLQAERLADLADLAGAMSIEALKATDAVFQAKIHALRPHAGQVRVAHNMARLLADSQIMESHRDCEKVQDSYSLRCIPQVHGPVRDIAAHVRSVLETEINSITDNPIVFPETGEIVTGGNFHGEQIALALDYLALGLTELTSISERRIDHLVNPRRSQLPAFLAKEGGLSSGFMLAHVTAAALASENKTFSHPASTDSIPTSGDQEDHVSMGLTAANKTMKISQNLKNVLAIEFLAAAQGLEFHKPLRPSTAVSKVYQVIRKNIPFMEQDRVMSDDIKKMASLLDGDDLEEIHGRFTHD